MRRIRFIIPIVLLLVINQSLLADFGTNWTGSFYDNVNFSGQPTVINGIDGINFNWPDVPEINNIPVVGIGADNFSARFTSVQTFGLANYQFTITYDDDIRFVIDGNVVFEDFTGGSVKTHSFIHPMTAEPHSLVVEFIEFTGAAVIQLQWTSTLHGPQLIAPSNGAFIEDSTPTFSWRAVPSAVEYQIQIDDDNNFFSPESEGATTNRQYTPNMPLPQGLYYWHVRTTNSAWSAVRQFTIGLLRPRLNYFTTSGVVLTWNPISWADRYVVQISRNLAFTDLVETIPSSDIDVQYTLENGTYYWRVQAIATDQTRKWSVPERITVEMP